jgi:hypothetical protein
MPRDTRHTPLARRPGGLTRRWRAAAVLACILARSASAEPSASRLASAALKACEDGRRAETRDERQARWAEGQALAEQAVALDDRSADAHFALFCNLGEMLRLDGASPSWSGFRRMMAELDRTLALRPDHTDALAVKGILLTRLPRLLGGNAREGEAILRHVVRIDPQAVSSRLTLAGLCAARGEREEAAALAAEALERARVQGRAAERAEAEALLARLTATQAAADPTQRVALR